MMECFLFHFDCVSLVSKVWIFFFSQDRERKEGMVRSAPNPFLTNNVDYTVPEFFFFFFAFLLFSVWQNNRVVMVMMVILILLLLLFFSFSWRCRTSKWVFVDDSDVYVVFIGPSSFILLLILIDVFFNIYIPFQYHHVVVFSYFYHISPTFVVVVVVVVLFVDTITIVIDTVTVTANTNTNTNTTVFVIVIVFVIVTVIIITSIILCMIQFNFWVMDSLDPPNYYWRIYNHLLEVE